MNVCATLPIGANVIIPVPEIAGACDNCNDTFGVICVITALCGTLALIAYIPTCKPVVACPPTRLIIELVDE